MRLIVIVRIPVSVQPPRHPQPANLDPVGLGKYRLPRRRRIVAGPGKLEAYLLQVFAALSKPGPSLVHHVIVCERHNLDPTRLQRLGQLHRRVKQERLRPMRVFRRNRRFKVHKPEVCSLKHVRHIAEQRRPPRLAIARCRSRRPHRLMRNHIPRHGKDYLRQVVRIRSSHRGCAVAGSQNGKQCGADGKTDADHGKRPPMLAQNAAQLSR